MSQWKSIAQKAINFAKENITAEDVKNGLEKVQEIKNTFKNRNQTDIVEIESNHHQSMELNSIDIPVIQVQDNSSDEIKYTEFFYEKRKLGKLDEQSKYFLMLKRKSLNISLAKAKEIELEIEEIFNK